jgi:hypothetical protein
MEQLVRLLFKREGRLGELHPPPPQEKKGSSAEFMG